MIYADAGNVPVNGRVIDHIVTKPDRIAELVAHSVSFSVHVVVVCTRIDGGRGILPPRIYSA
jgi:hypothetical protein